ncbi:hypothetical protein AVEN_169908-1 [Araneus ventricosus]|uniref:Uncharacterized protein n=1 Tax=Araneus ventricosus TaxID=182803 RepID=A0A4Y2EWX6_ARAVE|nr:hypothetical protein AVEN_169908-1 [Araneus ventricosus]
MLHHFTLDEIRGNALLPPTISSPNAKRATAFLQNKNTSGISCHRVSAIRREGVAVRLHIHCHWVLKENRLHCQRGFVEEYWIGNGECWSLNITISSRSYLDEILSDVRFS